MIDERNIGHPRADDLNPAEGAASSQTAHHPLRRGRQITWQCPLPGQGVCFNADAGCLSFSFEIGDLPEITGTDSRFERETGLRADHQV